MKVFFTIRWCFLEYDLEIEFFVLLCCLSKQIMHCDQSLEPDKQEDQDCAYLRASSNMIRRLQRNGGRDC
jgi:hypothetical protein